MKTENDTKREILSVLAKPEQKAAQKWSKEWQMDSIC